VRTPLDDPTRSDWNVISDSSSGDPNNILVVDAHLDAIYGAGILRRPPKRRPPSRQWPLHQVRKPHLNIRPPDRQPKNSPPHKKPKNPTPPLRRSQPPESHRCSAVNRGTEVGSTQTPMESQVTSNREVRFPRQAAWHSRGQNCQLTGIGAQVWPLVLWVYPHHVVGFGGQSLEASADA
jgi:hypothetical protein